MPTVTSPVPTVDWEKQKLKLKHLVDLPIESSGGHRSSDHGQRIVNRTGLRAKSKLDPNRMDRTRHD
jgi:hypothetical protein